MNTTSQIIKTEQVQRYLPLKIPQILLDLIESRTKFTYHKIPFLITPIISVALLSSFFFEGFIILKILGFSYIGIIVIADTMFSKNARAAKAIRKQVVARNSPSKKELKLMWKVYKYYTIAKEINLICIEQIPWNNDTVFLPDDPFCLMIELYTGDLCEVEAIMAIEETFSIKFPKDFFEEKNPGDLKFRDVVNYIIGAC